MWLRLTVVLTHMLKFSYWRRARQGILAHTQGLVVVIKLTHLALLAVMVEAGVWERKHKKIIFLCPFPPQPILSKCSKIPSSG